MDGSGECINGGSLGSLCTQGGVTVGPPIGGKRLQLRHGKQGCLLHKGGEA
jgi:hypothetical protein